MDKPYFTGPFAPMCELFVAQKRAAGILFDSQAKRLRQFDNFCKDLDISGYSITEELMSNYCKRRLNESDNARRDRIYIVRAFADFLNRQGYSSFVIPELPKRGAPHKPYIFTKDELRKIFNSFDELETSNFTTMPIMFPTLFRTLYGCGLRVSEALSLTKNDVDTENGTIHVVCGKNGHERINPMSVSLIEEYRRFMSETHNDTNETMPLFYNKNRERFSTATVGKQFRNVLWDVGIAYLGPNAGPRVHDIRHTFMCHNIQAWAEAGIPIYSKLPILSKYVGHTSISATQWYLRLTAQIYPHIREICERELGGMYDRILDAADFEGVCEDE